MSYVIRRTEKDGTETVIGCASDIGEACIIIEEDMAQIDWEAVYRTTEEED